MSIQETSQAMAALTQLEVQLLADKIVDEISGLGKKSVSKRRIIAMVAGELQKMGVLVSREDASLDEADRQSCSPAL
jgi:hypothetical protein